MDVALEAIQAAVESIDTDNAAALVQLTSIDTALEAIQTSQASIAASDGQGAFSVNYYFSAVDFGAGDSTQVFTTPAGFRGSVKAVSVYNVTEAFTADTTPARLDIGDGVDADEFALTASLGTTAIGASVTPAITDGDTPVITAADIVTVTFVAPTGGTPAGIADVVLTVSYYL
jgi:hypothetical protein